MYLEILLFKRHSEQFVKDSNWPRSVISSCTKACTPPPVRYPREILESGGISCLFFVGQCKGLSIDLFVFGKIASL